MAQTRGAADGGSNNGDGGAEQHRDIGAGDGDGGGAGTRDAAPVARAAAVPSAGSGRDGSGRPDERWALPFVDAGEGDNVAGGGGGDNAGGGSGPNGGAGVGGAARHGSGLAAEARAAAVPSAGGGEEAEDNISGDEDLPIDFRFLDEKTPRERASKTKPERDAMEAAHVHVDNNLPSKPGKAYSSWSSWIDAYEGYFSSHHVGFRTRTSKTVDVYNRKHNVHATEARFHKSLVNYRCIHGVHQERRGEVTRNVDVNYTGAVLALMWP
ncbi:hypothetical protein PHYPSEUDO_000379 [Phytophthora pseudosyringae]|uniref:Uncharacterized protein n=1 Tax=Phytophthora pseudosyringae TaxID=221518 RepID=A0A8T1W2X2_9STRA|nr:hypothetical protein PHYPSEUDO_000379 [Phytophthora pseudosyringae]